MRSSLLADLRCPFCGGVIEAVGLPPGAAASIDYGVLSCVCCAYPVAEGIPVLALSDDVTKAIHAIERGERDEALGLLLDLPPERREVFAALRDDETATFAQAVRALLPDGEGDYYVLRYGDPTFVVADAITRTVASCVELPPRTRVVDVCGGCGHLSTTLAVLAADRPGVTPTLLDRSFWRLWLAQRFLAPTADVVCCDANVPLPLATGCASMSVCNDAIHYVWGKRLVTSELQRITSWSGAVVVTHAHSVLGDNASAGNTLTPAGYASLFERHAPVAGRDDDLLEWALGRGAARWRADANECGSADAIALVAMPNAAARLDVPPPAMPANASGLQWIVNPLLAVTADENRTRLAIAWPSDHYAWEFSAVSRYLDDETELPSGALDDLEALAHARPDLVTRRVLLRVPRGYAAGRR